MENGGGMSGEQLTAEERDLLSRRKSPDLTPRESLLQIELQTRVLVLKLADAVERDARLVECAALKADIMALDFERDGMATINAVGQKGMELNRRVAAIR
jgi:hypothetical protein